MKNKSWAHFTDHENISTSDPRNPRTLVALYRVAKIMYPPLLLYGIKNTNINVLVIYLHEGYKCTSQVVHKRNGERFEFQ